MFDVLGALPEARRELAGRGPLAGHAVLDVFAGSGALGIEALSRGADSCAFVESAPPALRALRGNLTRRGGTAAASRASGAASDASAAAADAPEAAAEPHAVVLAGDVRRALAADAGSGTRYTLVFADPPYDMYEQVRPALARLLGRVLVPGAVLVVESAAGTAAGLPWTVVREKRYGDTRVTFLVTEAAPPAEGVPGD
jgi:16S rRNA (guanine(966)-N(2))-methyltransferase RsmD